MPGTGVLRIGTRGSALALAQATLVRDALREAGAAAELTTITTAGDRRTPDTAWGEGAFVTAIEDALLGGEIDLAVHSAKDVPTDENPRLSIAAYLPRASALDVVVTRAGPDGRPARSLAELPSGARVGTDSPRRTAFLMAARPDLRLHPLHGNVDTRLRRLDEGESDALVLAEAGLTRLGREDRIAFRLDPEEVPPAPGQGALAVQVRVDDDAVAGIVSRLDDVPTRHAVETERELLAASGGGCRAPLGALASVIDGEVDLLAGFARPDGSVRAVARRAGAVAGPAVVDDLLSELATAGADAAARLGDPAVIVSRAREQAAALLLALVDRGFAPRSVPAISIEPASETLAPVLARLAEFDWVIVTSVNAVRALRRAADVAGRPLGSAGGERPRWAAVGVATARAMTAAGIRVDVRPSRSSGRDLASAIPLKPGERVLVPRSDIADHAMLDALAERGAIVESVVAYRTLEAPPPSVALLATALADDPVAVVLTSGSTARGLLALAARLDAVDRIRALDAVCIGPGTAEVATELGYRVAAEAGMRSVAGIADSVVESVGRRQGGAGEQGAGATQEVAS